MTINHGLCYTNSELSQGKEAHIVYAVVETGGKQYKVEPESIIKVEKLEGNKGDLVTLTKVLALGKEGDIQVGTPYVKDAKVKAEIKDQVKGDKLTVFKYKPKKRVRVKNGHRQQYTLLKVKEIA